jgi:pyruvate carboxylase
MAGLCRPYAAHKLVKALKDAVGIPIHFHTHDTSGVASASVLRAADAGVDVVDLALASMSGSTSQPNLNSVVAALQHTPRDTGLDRESLDGFSDYWEHVREFYKPFDTAPKTGSAEVYLHEMPGGQYTNLKEQAVSMAVAHRWPEIARTYAEVNQLFGDIVKVTPSSKVVGDMALFLFSRGIRPADVVNLRPGETPFPESVIDMLTGGLGWPEGGWPEAVSLAVLGPKRHAEARAKYEAALAAEKKRARAVDRAGAKAKREVLADGLAAPRAELAEKLRHEPTDDQLFSHLMYPAVFAEFTKTQREYGDVSVLPTPAFFYGLTPGEEITVDIEEGKTLIIRLVSVGAPDADGRRSLSFELNGMAREAFITDKGVAPKAKTRPTADLADALQVAAPIPGLVAVLYTSVGAKVGKGDKLFTMEAMKMQTTVFAPVDGVVAEVHAAVGETVEAKDLIVRLRG